MGIFDFMRGGVRSAGVAPMFDGFATSFIGAGMVRLDATEGDAFSNSAVVYRCLMTIAQSLAALDLAVLDDQGEMTEDHQVARLFNRNLGDINGKPAPMSARVFRERFWLRKEVQGQTFAYILRDGTEDGEAVALRDIPWRTQVLVSEDQEELVGFRVHGPQGLYHLMPWEVLWDRYPHPTEPWGCLAPLQAASFATDMDDYLRTWQKSELRNGARPAGVVFLGDMNAAQRDEVRSQFDARQTGPQNAGKHLFLSGTTPAAYTRIGLTPAELDYLGSRTFDFDEIKMGLGVPVGMWKSDQTYENQRSNENQLWTLTLLPKADTSASEIDRQLLPDDGETAVWDSRGVAALKENDDAVAHRVKEVMQVDVLTIDDGRQMLGLEPLPGGIGGMTLSAYRAQFGFSPLGGGTFGGGSGSGDGTPLAKDEETGARSADAGFSRFSEKQQRVVERAIERRAKKGQAITVDDVFDLSYWDQVGMEMGLEDVGLLNRTTQARLRASLPDVSRVFQKLDVRSDGSRGEKAKAIREKRLAPVIDQGAATLRQAFRQQHELFLNGLSGTVRDAQPLPSDLELLLASLASDVSTSKVALSIHEAAMREAVSTAEEDYGLSVSWDLVNPKLADIRSLLASRVTGLDDTTREDLRAAIAAGLDEGEAFQQIAGRVGDVFNQAVDYRSVMIARTEALQAYGQASAVSYREAAVEQVEVYDGDYDEECAAINGSVVTLDEGEALMADEHPNGTRGLAPVVDLGLGEEAA